MKDHTVEEQQVRESRDTEAEVAVGEAEFAIVLPIPAEVVFTAGDGERRREGDVCAGRADDGVNLTVHAVFRLDASLGEAGDRRADERDVGLCQSLQISRSGRQSPAVRAEGGHNLVEKLGLVC